MFPRDDIESMPVETLEAEITTLYSRISAETCRWLLLVAEFDRREAYFKWDCHTCAHWLSWFCGVALRAAQDHVRVARRLGDLPQITEAFARGELSYSKVRALARMADSDSEARLLDIALNASAAQLERVASAYRRATSLSDPGVLAARRHAGFYWSEDGCLEIRACLMPDEGAIVMKALELARSEIIREVSDESLAAERGDRRPIREARATNADALVRLAEAGVAASGSGASGGDSTQVVVHVDLDSLAAEGESLPSRGRSEIEGGPGIHPKTLRRLACDSSLVTIAERDGEPLSVGRKTRSIPPAVRRALRTRDGGCRFPGCSGERFIDAHHVKHWADGGKTELSNLIHLCRRHHRLLHEGRFSVEARSGGDFVFRDRHGVELRASPPLPGATASRRSLADAVADSRQRRRLRAPFGPCAPRNPGPLDLDLTMLVLLQDRPPPGASSRHEVEEAGPAP
jgi:Domain of unknown function (DUF222)/HNH endonuclease